MLRIVDAEDLEVSTSSVPCRLPDVVRHVPNVALTSLQAHLTLAARGAFSGHFVALDLQVAASVAFPKLADSVPLDPKPTYCTPHSGRVRGAVRDAALALTPTSNDLSSSLRQGPD